MAPCSNLLGRFSLVLVFATAAAAQVGEIQQPVIVARNVGIKNLSDSTTVHFDLQLQGHDRWLEYSLTPGQMRDFRCGKDFCRLSIKTVDKAPLKYKLLAEKRYAIVWERESERWEVNLVED